jgi:hypothetical protein
LLIFSIIIPAKTRHMLARCLCHYHLHKSPLAWWNISTASCLAPEVRQKVAQIHVIIFHARRSLQTATDADDPVASPARTRLPSASGRPPQRARISF